MHYCSDSFQPLHQLVVLKKKKKILQEGKYIFLPAQNIRSKQRQMDEGPAAGNWTRRGKLGAQHIG